MKHYTKSIAHLELTADAEAEEIYRTVENMIGTERIRFVSTAVVEEIYNYLQDQTIRISQRTKNILDSVNYVI